MGRRGGGGDGAERGAVRGDQPREEGAEGQVARGIFFEEFFSILFDAGGAPEGRAPTLGLIKRQIVLKANFSHLLLYLL